MNCPCGAGSSVGLRFPNVASFSQGLARSLLQPPASEIALALLGAMAETVATHGDVAARRSALGALTQIATDWLPQAQSDNAAAATTAAAAGAQPSPTSPQQQQQQQQLPPVPADFAAGFASFAVEKLGGPATLAAPLRGDFSPDDAAGMGVVLDLCTLQLLLVKRCGEAWTTYAAAVMQSAGCPPATVEQYISELKARAHNGIE